MAKSVQVQKVNNWHEALSDFMISCPQASAGEAAELFEVSEAWLSIVKNSDSFKDFHRKRREQHFDRISQGVGQKLEALSEVVLDETLHRIEKSKRPEEADIPLSGLTDVGRMALNALGFGGRGGVQVNVNQDNRNVMINDSEALRRARDRLAEVRAENDQKILEGRAQQVVNAAGNTQSTAEEINA